MKVVDVHAHWMPGWFAGYAEAAAADPSLARRFRSLLGPYREALTRVSRLVADMDAAGVDMALLSVPPPAAAVECDQRPDQVAARLNTELVATVEAHRGRLMAVLALPLPDADAAVAEVRRWTGHAAVAGVCLPVANGDRGIDDPALEPVYRTCADQELPVFLHPALDEPSEQYRRWSLHSAIGAPVASTVAAVRLVLSGMLDRVPGLTVVVPHLGGALPFLFSRLADQATPSAAEHELSYYLRERLFYDTCSFHPPALRCALTTFGTGRLMLGSDYPFRGPVSRATRDIADNMAGPDRDAVMGGNAGRLLSIRTAGH